MLDISIQKGKFESRRDSSSEIQKEPYAKTEEPTFSHT